MGKQTFCRGENKGADQLHSNCEADQRLFFATWIVQFLCFLNPKFPASNNLLRMYNSVYVGPGQNPNCWFSHAQAHIHIKNFGIRKDYMILLCVFHIKGDLKTKKSYVLRYGVWTVGL